MHTKCIKFILISFLLLIFQISACGLIPKKTGKWSHPTNPQATIKKDHYQCIAQAWEQYPKKIGFISAENSHWENARNATTECKYSKYTKTTHCNHTPASERQFINSDIIEGDINERTRVKAYAECMTSKDASYNCIKDNKIVDGGLCGNYQ